MADGEFRGDKLRAEVEQHCEALREKRWGAASWPLDYREALANWRATREAEEKAGKLLAALRYKIETAREFLQKELGDTDGGHNTSDLRCIVRAVDAAPAEVVDHLPLIRPGIRSWMAERHIRERFPGASTRDLAVLSLIAGLWPPRMVAGTVEQVLAEQEKAVSSAEAALERLYESIGEKQ